MKNTARKDHWERIYATRRPDEVSWTQENPKTSLDFIHSFHLSKTASIIDVGAGDSKLVDRLLDEGFEDITVLDISDKALERARARLGSRAAKVNWIVSDITDFVGQKSFDLWHDRATFHFLVTAEQIDKYLESARKSIRDNGFLTLGTFSDKGPTRCSGLEVRQYTEEALQTQLKEGFEKIRCLTEDHRTPAGALQNFLFCSFKRHLN